MNNTHSKAPFTIDVSTRVLEANDNKAAIVNANGEVICFIEKTLGMEEVGNAKLIAAAPDLLEACRLILREKTNQLGETPELRSWQRETLENAIKKATGDEK